MESDWFSETDFSVSATRAQILNDEPKHQRASIHKGTNIPTPSRIVLQGNAMLLKSSILRISNDPRRGLGLAEQVVSMAEQNNLPALASKAQLYRGLCLYDLGLYADAGRCFTRAASVNWFAREVPRLTALAEKKRRVLPVRNPRRRLSPGFKDVPLSTSARGASRVAPRLEGGDYVI